MKNILKNYLDHGILGKKIRLESSSVCQLKCPECPQSSGDMGVIGKGFLKFDDFKAFVDKYPAFTDIELSNYGEMFLNPELGEIIRYAFEKKIDLTAENGVNLNTVDDGILEDLVKYRFKSMYVSLDGVTDDTYKIYRQGGDLNTVLANIEKINAYKKQYGSVFPLLSWQFVIFGHNEHELPEAREMARKLNMRFVPKLNAHPGYSPVRDKEALRKETGAASRDEYENKTGALYTFPCYQLWMSPMINWDGKLLGCCLNEWDDFGNVFRDGLGECVRSDKYMHTKKVLTGREENGRRYSLY